MQHIIRHLFRVETLEEVPRQQLEELVEEYPSFGVGRYLLSRKLQAEAASHFGEETQKTNLYFTNPFWLQWLLRDEHTVAQGFAPINGQVLTEEAFAPVQEFHATEEAFAPVHEPHPTEEAFAPVHEPHPTEEAFAPVHEPHPTEEAFAPVHEPHPTEEAFAPVHEPHPTEEAFAPGDEHPPTEETFSTDGIHSAAEEAFAPTQDSPDADKMVQPDEWNAAGGVELPAEDVFAPVLDNTEETIHSAADEILKSIAEINDQRQARIQEAADALLAAHEETAPSMGIAGLALEQAEEGSTIPEQPAELPQLEQPQEPVVESIHQEQPQEPVAESIHQEQPQEPVAELTIPDQPVEVIPVQHTPVAGHPSPPIFEPFYTVDYFASQGIRLTLDENPSDRLGKQLKSFTDWLKVMRRLPQKNREIVPDIAAEHQVQTIAAHSIEGREVITETMADVLAKQGMREKATEMYRKLSLLEPEKSAYFATKIEQLKVI